MDKLEIALDKARQERAEKERAQALVSPARTPFQPRLASAPAMHTLNISEAYIEKNLVFAHRLRDANADIYRLLRTQVLQAMGKIKARTLAITSADYGEGKTTIALNLAISIALDVKQTALLVDLDLRKPCIASYLGIAPEKGLTDHLVDDVPLADCLVRLPFERLSVLPSMGTLANSSETLGSPMMAALARELKSRYPDRFVIYDMPPLLTQDDPLAFLPHVDAVLMVVREGSTRQHDIRRCLEVLQGAPIIGTVLNDCIS